MSIIDNLKLILMELIIHKHHMQLKMLSNTNHQANHLIHSYLSVMVLYISFLNFQRVVFLFLLRGCVRGGVMHVHHLDLEGQVSLTLRYSAHLLYTA